MTRRKIAIGIVSAVAAVLIACESAPSTPVCKEGPDGKPTPVPCRIKGPREK